MGVTKIMRKGFLVFEIIYALIALIALLALFFKNTFDSSFWAPIIVGLIILNTVAFNVYYFRVWKKEKSGKKLL